MDEEQDIQHTVDQFKTEMSENVQIECEADRSEYIEVLYELVGRSLSKDQILSVVSAQATARAVLIKGSGKDRIEIFGDLIMTMKHKNQEVGIGPNGQPFTEPEHYAVYTKLHKKALDALALKYGIECKNG